MGVSGQGYTWEEEYKRSWDILQEDEQGSLQGIVSSIQQQQWKKRRLHKDVAVVQRGIIRHLYVVIDLSAAMADLDLKPSRLECTMSLLTQFINEYFDQNPLSQIGLILTRDGLAEKVTELSGNPIEHITALKKRENREPRGEPSLQNALELARTSLVHVPQHGSREILVLFASLTTCDPHDIFDTVESLKKDQIRVSMVGLAAEVRICRVICEATSGSYDVILNEAHFKELLFDNIPPPPVAAAKSISNLIQMGFPTTTHYEKPTLCACHQKLIMEGYQCPQCATVVCDIPTDCPVCMLTLVSSPLLARSYHHLFPVATYKELSWASITSEMPPCCFSCQQPFTLNAPHVIPGQRRLSISKAAFEPGSTRFQCEKCHHQFCIDCDFYVHDVLHNCPGCVNK
ncbi:Ssl1-like-domain-containing protein [Gaertneriomyces semiglobifer]|nr:Ssl1-like-domain-containing protein [Gaertneriomyces semiglobifer]